jgi:NhaA family Na+:H+ antiporter
MNSTKYPLERLFGRILSPFEQFLRRATAGGIILLSATIMTLILANSHWGGSLHHFWEYPLYLGVGSHRLDFTPHLLVNDGLMTLFFLLVGLELKREILVGELSSMRDAALPVVAALGGMVFPALIYHALNRHGAAAHGWGIPMATDIAFAVGILVLLAGRVPRNLIIFLTALAIADDLGAVVVIALFYTQAISITMLGAVGGALVFLVLLNRAGIRNPVPYVVGGVLLWFLMLQSGIHATMAGVLLACAIPARPVHTATEFDKRLAQLRGMLKTEHLVRGTPHHSLGNPRMAAIAQGLEDTAKAVQSPLQRMENAMNPWVTFLVVPMFALSNAGINFSQIRPGEILGQSVTLGIVLGLVVGKFLGIGIFSWLAVKLRIARLPTGVKWPHLLGVGWLGGIGFTMSLFIDGLAFADPLLKEYAKFGILFASTISSIVGIVWLYIAGRRKAPREA